MSAGFPRAAPSGGNASHHGNVRKREMAAGHIDYPRDSVAISNATECIATALPSSHRVGCDAALEMTIVRPCARLQVAGDFRRSVELGLKATGKVS
jgi:hypothetical protein